MQEVFRTEGPVVIYPASGTGAWEAALVNTLSPGDRVLAFETGHFATLWKGLAERFGLEVDWVEGDWRHGVDPDKVAAVLRQDPSIARRDGRPQRDLDRRHQPRARGARGDGRRRLGRAAAGRHHLLAGLDRLPARRVGRRRHRRRLAEGPDAPGRPELQRDQREGARRLRDRAAPALVLGLGADHRGQPRRLLALHVGHQPALRPARGDRHAARGGARERVRAPPAPRGGDPRRGAAAGGSRSCAPTSASTPAR